MELLLIIGLIFLAVGIFYWIKFVLYIFKILNDLIFKNTIEANTNNYIEAQKFIDINNANYEEYLFWMKKNSGGVPLNKIKTFEEIEVEKKINDILN